MPPVHFCLCKYKTASGTAMRLSKTPIAIYRRIKFCTSLLEMSTWWHRNRKYILENQRKAVCLILNLPITSNKHFHRLLSYFHGHLTWICCWHGFLISVFTGNAIRLTNRLQKMDRNVWCENAAEKCSTFIKNIGFGVMHTCIVYMPTNCSPGYAECCHGPAWENPRWRLRPEIVRHSVKNMRMRPSE